MIDKFDVYRISEPIFRVHARLFKVQEAILRSCRQQIRAYKLSVASQAAGIPALLLFLLTLIVDIFEIKWNSVTFWILLGILVLVVLIHAYDYQSLKKTEQEFDRMIDDIGGEDVERWVDYATSVIAGYGTRLKMIGDMQEELQEKCDRKEVSEARYQERNAFYVALRKYCVDRLAYYREMNEELFKKGKRSKEDHDEVLEFIRQAAIGLTSEELGIVGLKSIS